MQIGNKIKQLRKLSGMTQEQLAEKLNDPLQEGETVVTDKNDERITLEDLVKINLHNRRMTLLLMSGLIFMMVGILNFVYVVALQQTTISTQYMLYRYIVTGNYENAPVDYMGLLTPSVIAGVTGLALCVCYAVKNSRKKSDHRGRI